jgi:hypothetical protein
MQPVLIPPGLPRSLGLPAAAKGVVLFAHGSGSGRLSPRNNFVAGELRKVGIGTLPFDLLTEIEGEDPANVFDIELLAGRLLGATDWVSGNADSRDLPIGYFGASTGAGATPVAAAGAGDRVAAVVSRGGRRDLAGPALSQVRAPTLFGGGRRGFRGCGAQPPSPEAAALQEPARDRARRHPSVRGAGKLGACGRARARLVRRSSSAGGREPCGSLTAPRPVSSWHASYCTWRTGSPSSSAWYAAAFRSATRWRSCSTRPSMWCWCARSAYPGSASWRWVSHRRRRGAREGYQRRAGRSAVDSPGLHRRRNRPPEQGNRTPSEALYQGPATGLDQGRHRHSRRRRHRDRRFYAGCIACAEAA